MSRLMDAFWRLSHPDRYEAARPIRDRLWLEVNKVLTANADDMGSCRAAMVVVGAMLEGPDANRLAHLTGYHHDFVAQVAVRMRAAGLWTDSHIDCASWAEDEPVGHSNFRRDLFVAEGRLFRDPKTGRYLEKTRYKSPAPKRIADPDTKKLVLHKLQTAYLLQNELWDVTSSVAEILEWNLDDLMGWITLNCVLDEGRYLKESDVEYYFGNGPGDPTQIDPRYVG